jgi:glycosyltransferase involved in cell wall biosynthesis
MKIVHVVESLDIGGLEQVVVALAGAQKHRGHQVEIICLWHPGALALSAHGLGIPVTCCFKRRGPDIKAWSLLRRLLRKAKPDVVHTHNSMAHYYSVAALWGQPPLRTVNTRHGMGSSQMQARRERLYRLALSRTQAAISVCGAARERYVKHGVMPASKAMVVPNGIDLSRFVVRSAARGAQLRASLGLSATSVVFGSVGRLHEAKRQVLLLDAVAQLRAQGLDATLVLAGDGDERAALQAHIDTLGLAPHARLLGARDDVPALLAGMDVFVLPSRTEGYSLALVEACASALPVIACDVGGNGEIVRTGLNGTLVPSDHFDALVQAMRQMHQDESLRLTLGRQARTWALREGSLETMADRYLALYQGRTPAVDHAALARP